MVHGNGSTPARWSLPRGRVLRRALRRDPTQEYLLYVPLTAEPGAPVLVSVHGISRNASEQATVFAPVCERHGAVMLAPVFTVDQHKDYQRLGRKGRGLRADLLLHQFLSEIATLTGADVTRVLMFGFSGGAQFAHRYVLAHPHRVMAAVVAASGWYTFPDNGQRYPYGIRPHRSLENVGFNPEEFLRVPIEVLVGGADTDTHNLRATERTNAQQGLTRVDRARNWVAAMRTMAAAHGIEPVVRLNEVPGMGHSFLEFCEQGELVAHAEHALFSDPVAGAGFAAVGGRSATNGHRDKHTFDESGE